VHAIANPGDRLMVLLIAGSGILNQFFTLVSGVIAARMLGVEGRGQVVLVVVLAQTVSQLTLGGSLPNAITKELAGRGLKARDGLHGLVGRWVLWALLGGLGASVYFLAVSKDLNPTAVALAVEVALMAMQSMASRILIGAMLGEGSNPIKIAMTAILPQLAAALVLGIALASGLDWNAVEVVALMLVIQGLVLATRLPSLASPTGRVEDRLDRGELAGLARRTHIGSVGPLDGLSLDRTLVGTMLGNAALGLYSAAVALGSLSAILGICVAMVALPKISAAQNGDPATEQATVRRWLLASVVLIVPTTLVFELLNPFLIPLLFGHDFKPAVPAGYWYVAASGFLSFRRTLIVVLQGRGRGHLASWIELALTPFVVLAVVAAKLADNLEVAGIGMLIVGIASVAMLSIAVARSRPASAHQVPLGGEHPTLAVMTDDQLAGGERLLLDAELGEDLR
jgi:O-antigen/teichoic acid export membrane protein